MQRSSGAAVQRCSGAAVQRVEARCAEASAGAGVCSDCAGVAIGEEQMVQRVCKEGAKGVQRGWMQRAQRAQWARKVAAHRGGRVARRRARGRRIARYGACDRHRMRGHGHACDRLALNWLALYWLAEGGGVPVGGRGNVGVVGPRGLARVGARVRTRVTARARGGEG